MVRHMKGTDKMYRAYIKKQYFAMHDDYPFTMQPGPYEYTESSVAYGPYTAPGPAKSQLTKELRGEPMSVDEGRAKTDQYNDRIKQTNANPPTYAWRTSPHQPQPLREWYYVVTDFGIEFVEPSDWKRLP